MARFIPAERRRTIRCTKCGFSKWVEATQRAVDEAVMYHRDVECPQRMMPPQGASSRGKWSGRAVGA